MKEKTKVLFLCIHNSARSQMAEAFTKRIGGDRFEVESAGLRPGELNPLVVRAMNEVGIDIAGNMTKGVFDLFKAGKRYHYVVTVCDDASAEKCPVFPGMAKRLHWSFPDPSLLQGTDEEKMRAIREIRDDIKAQVEGWVASLSRKE